MYKQRNEWLHIECFTDFNGIINSFCYAIAPLPSQPQLHCLGWYKLHLAYKAITYWMFSRSRQHHQQSRPCGSAALWCCCLSSSSCCGTHEGSTSELEIRRPYSPHVAVHTATKLSICLSPSLSAVQVQLTNLRYDVRATPAHSLHVALIHIIRQTWQRNNFWTHNSSYLVYCCKTSPCGTMKQQFRDRVLLLVLRSMVELQQAEDSWQVKVVDIPAVLSAENKNV